jgi:hypothetical protein
LEVASAAAGTRLGLLGFGCDCSEFGVTGLGAGGICDSEVLGWFVAVDVGAPGSTEAGFGLSGGGPPLKVGFVGGTLADDCTVTAGAVEIRVEGGGGGFCGCGGIRLGDGVGATSSGAAVATTAPVVAGGASPATGADTTDA